MPKTPEERFWPKVEKTAGCWVWKGSRDKMGYGHFKLNSKIILAHRFVVLDKITDEVDVCHKCDNPSCVRPDHLFFGTHTDNMRDSMTKDRHAFKLGENNPLSKLTDAQAMILKACPKTYGAIKRMTSSMGVHRSAVYYIQSQRGWTHLPRPSREDFVRSQEYLNSLP
jgi:hypothetical protein